jgi:hypothetical protein
VHLVAEGSVEVLDPRSFASEALQA